MANKKNDQAEKINEVLLGYEGLLGKKWPKPKEPLVVVLTHDGIRKACRVSEDEVLTMVPERELYGYFVRYLRDAGDPRYLPTPNLCEQLAKQWRAAKKPILYQEVPMLRLKSEPGLCWNRVAYDARFGPTPLFDDFVGRLEYNQDAFMAYTGSLFIGDCPRQQYLILYGAAQAGKGTYLRLLEKCLGDASTPCDQSPRGSDKHWFAGIYNKRLVYFDDFTDPQAFSHGKLKSATGGNYIPVDPKGQSPFRAKMDAGFIFTMNDTPQLKNTWSDLRRAICCRVLPRQDQHNSAAYEDDLEQEIPAIINKCISKYKELTLNGEREIPVDSNSFGDVTHVDSANHEYFWARWFLVDKGSEALANEVKDSFQRANILSNIEMGEHYRWLLDNTIAERKCAHGRRWVCNIRARLVNNIDAKKAIETWRTSVEEGAFSVEKEKAECSQFGSTVVPFDRG